MVRHVSRGLMAVFAMQHQHAQLRREPIRLAPPVSHQADRRHDEYGAIKPARLLFNQYMGQCLQRFTQAHVISQDAA